MQLQYCSDLHLEFAKNRQWLSRYPLQSQAPILLMAGDIIPFNELDKHKEFFNHLSDHFEKTYWIPRNHEYYHADITERSGSFSEKIRENVLLLNNQAVLEDGVKLVFSTLWSKISPANEWQIERSLSDFQVIKNQDRFFSVADVNRLHAECMDFLQREINSTDEMRTVVVTHHVPTYLHYPTKYRISELNESFAVELYDFIEKSAVQAWIYGHVHYNTADFNIGNTLLTTNQLGYVKRGEHKVFGRNKVIEV